MRSTDRDGEQSAATTAEEEEEALTESRAALPLEIDPAPLRLPTASFDPALVHSVLEVAVVPPQANGPTAAASVRLPVDLRDLARQVVEAGWASSLSELIVAGLRRRLRALAVSAVDDEALTEFRSALEEHYVAHPDARPPLVVIVQSAAELERHPAADRADLIGRAVDDLGEDAYVEDVLAWVKGAMAIDTRARAKRSAKATKAS